MYSQNQQEIVIDRMIIAILQKGAEWYASYGTEKSKGTKSFSLTGKVVRTGLIEVPMGITLREIVYDIGGGIPGNRRLKFWSS